MVQSLFLGLVLSSLIALAAYYKKSLSKSGVIGAILLGTLIFGAGWLGLGTDLNYLFCIIQSLVIFSEAK